MSLLKLNIPPVDLNLGQFEELIRQRGLHVRWEKAAMCPCVRADATSGRPGFNCGDCYNGNLFVDPKEILATITNITGQRNAQVYGDLAVGGIYITVSGEHRLGINDRITMVDQTARYAEMVDFPVIKTKASAAPGATSLLLEHTRKLPTPKAGSFVTVAVAGQTLRYTGKTVNTLTGIPATGTGAITTTIAANSDLQPLEYNLRYAPIQVFDARTDSGVLRQYTDFDLVERTRIRFKAATPPAKFTILYDSRPVYLVDQMAHEYRDQLLKLGVPQETFARFPVAAVCRKDFLNRVG